MSSGRKVVGYDVVTAWEIKDLIPRVNRKVSVGWECIGRSYQTTGDLYIQTMVKYEAKEEIQ